MRTKHFLLFTLGVFLVTLIACSKDSDGLSEDFNPKTSTSSRAVNNLRISYDMATSQDIKPTKGTIKDLCEMDIKIVSIPSSISTVTTTLGPSGEACLTILDKVEPRRGLKGKERKDLTTKTEYCNGVLVFTDSDGTQTTVDTEIDVAMFQTIYQSYLYTEIQKDSAMNVMILEAQNNGAKITQKGNALTISQTDEEGNTETIVYDIENHVVISNSTVDKNGNVISKTTLGYKCTQDGKIVPAYVINYTYKDDLICSDPIYSVEEVKFDNFKITF